MYRDRYKGEWKDGMMHGRGTFMWSKGDMYDGEWRAGKMHGHGVKKMGNGDVYDGEQQALFRMFVTTETPGCEEKENGDTCVRVFILEMEIPKTLSA